MATTLITEKYQDVIHDVLHCYDRVVWLSAAICNHFAMPKE
jgi:hypothetical protein